MEEEVKFGTEIIDGKFYNLDNMSSIELKELEENINDKLELMKQQIINQVTNNN